MTLLTLEELKKLILGAGNFINAPAQLLPAFGSTRNDGSPHLEIHEQRYEYVIVENGEELLRRQTSDTRELLYWVFDPVTFQMACDWEAGHRIENEDFRKQLFSIQIRLMTMVDGKFGERLRLQKEAILQVAPFRTPQEL